MSVINNVLKDLETKPSAFTPLNVDTFKTQNISKKSRNNLFVISLVVVTALTIFLLMQSGYLQVPGLGLSQNVDAVLDKSIEADTEVKVVSENTSVALLETPIIVGQALENNIGSTTTLSEIQGMQINETSDFLELSLQLSQQAQSHLKARNDNRYKFVISQSQNKISAPELKNNPWLHSLDFSQKESGVEVEFETVEGVLVETDHRFEAEKFNWVILLKKSIQEPEVVSPQSIKTLELNSMTANAASITPDKNLDETSIEAVKEPEKAVVKLQIKPTRLKPSVHNVLSSAVAAMKQKNWINSEKQLLQLINTEVDQAARVNLIKVYSLSQKGSEMQQLLDASLIRYPQNIELKVLHGQHLFSQKQYLALVDQYQEQQSNLTLLSLSAASFQRLGQHSKAIQKYQQALKKDPQQPKNWISMGISLEHENNIQAAKDAYQMALRSGLLNLRLQEFTQQRIKKLSGL